MAKDSCLSRISTGAAFGGAFGAAYGALLGIRAAFNPTDPAFIIRYDPFRPRMPPGLLKIRHVGQATLWWTAIFGLIGGVVHGVYGKPQKESSSDITNSKSHS